MLRSQIKGWIKTQLGYPQPEPPGEKGPDFYDRTFFEDANWRGHYTQSVDYYIWTVIVDRVRRRKPRSILEIGCGSGQLAHAIYDSGIVRSYVGFDFAAARLNQARVNVPDYRFEVADAFQTDLYDTVDYDLVICTEFLEHVERDLTVIERIRRGSRIIGLVPNFAWVSHVRYFKSTDEVAERYGPYFSDFNVDEIPMKVRGSVAFVFEGVRGQRTSS